MNKTLKYLAILFSSCVFVGYFVAEEDATFSPKWSAEFLLGVRYPQSSTRWGGAAEELVIPKQKSTFSQVPELRVSIGRYLKPRWHIALSAEYYKGKVDKWSAMVDRNGGLYENSTLFNTWKAYCDEFDDPTLCPPQDPQADGDEYLNSFDMGELTEIPIFFTFSRHFRIKQKLQPFIGVGAGYSYIDFSEGKINQTLLNIGPYGGLDTGGFGDRATGGVNDLIGLDPDNPNNCAAGHPCAIPAPQYKTSISSGLQYDISMGINVFATKRLAASLQTRYLWSQSKLSIEIDHPYLEYNTCPNTETEGCLVEKQGNVLWISYNTAWDPDAGGDYQHYWQFKEDTLKLERWEIFFGVRYLLGKGK